MEKDTIKTGVRCPYCNAKLAEFVSEIAVYTCKCKNVVIIDNRYVGTIEFKEDKI